MKGGKRDTSNARIAVIGTGRAGGALALLLARAGWNVTALANTRRGSARALARRCGAILATTDAARAAAAADAVLIAVPDRKIAALVRGLASDRRLALVPDAPVRGAARSSPRSAFAPSPMAAVAQGRSTRAARGSRPGARLIPRVALHLSGASGAEILEPLRRRGWSVGSFHPLTAFPPTPEILGIPRGGHSRSAGWPGLTGTAIAFDGDARARGLARDLARSLGARPLAIPASRRARYHLAACFASNYLVTLAAEGAKLLVGAGLGRTRALSALLPLMRATLSNLETAGLPGALTGPVARGDDVTIARHAALLRGSGREISALRELHARLVRRTMRLAQGAGWLDAAAIRRIERALATGAAGSLSPEDVQGGERRGRALSPVGKPARRGPSGPRRARPA